MSDTTEKFNDRELFNKRVSQLFILKINEAIRRKGEALVAISGGATPIPIFKIIKNKYRNTVEWSNVSFFWVDERCVPPTHSNSNFGSAYEAFLNVLENAKLYRMKGELKPEVAAMEYERYLSKKVPIEEGYPQFDLVWLGMGSDGHTASIFPNSDVIHDSDRWVRSVWVETLKAYRLTLTLPVINNSIDKIISLYGVDKFNLYRKIKKNRKKKYPIQYINCTTSNNYWIIGS